MWQAEPVLTFDWLLHADIRVIVILCLTLLGWVVVCDYLCYRKARKHLKRLNQSVLDTKNRVTRL